MESSTQWLQEQIEKLNIPIAKVDAYIKQKQDVDFIEEN